MFARGVFRALAALPAHSSAARHIPGPPSAPSLLLRRPRFRLPGFAPSSTTPAPSADLVNVTVNGHRVQVDRHETVLGACRAAHVHVPTLCHHPRLPAVGNCRVCLVEVAAAAGGPARLKPACVTPVAEDMVVETGTPAVEASARSSLQLILANHPNRCMTCSADGHCELQDLAVRFGLDDEHSWPKRRAFEHEWDDHTDALVRDLDKCIKCGRCVRACSQLQGMNVLGLAGRGADTHLATFGDVSMELTPCIKCGQCAWFCPTGAIVERPEVQEVMAKLSGGPEHRHQVNIAAFAPSVRVTLGEEFGLAPGSIVTGQLVQGLRDLGFDYVFDVNFTADLTIVEEATELLARVSKAAGLLDAETAAREADPATAAIGPMPMFTSCCPSWIELVEKSYPQLIPHLSSCRSPQGMMGSLVKNVFARRLGLQPENINMVSIMPCTSKKSEARRHALATNKLPDTDHVLTTRELARLFKMNHIQLGALSESQCDDPLGVSTGAAAIFGTTGGVMEAAVRTAYEYASGKKLDKLVYEDIRGLEGTKLTTVTIPLAAGGEVTLRLAVVHGTARARRLVERILEKELEVDFIEVMACQGGCIGGGGQPKSLDPAILSKRMAGIFKLDEASALRRSHENPTVQQLYAEELGAPGSHKAHHLLHTSYSRRETCFDRFKTAEEKAADMHDPLVDDGSAATK